MFRARKFSAVIAACAVMIGGGFASTVFAGGSSSMHDVAFDVDVNGNPPMAVKWRVEGQDTFAAVVDKIRGLEPSNLAWAMWRATADSNPMLYLVDQPGKRSRERIDALSVPVDVLTGAKYSEAELVSITQAFARELATRLRGTEFSCGPTFDGHEVVIEVWGHLKASTDFVPFLEIVGAVKREHPMLTIRTKNVLIGVVSVRQSQKLT